MPAVNGPIKRYCNSERCLALAMKSISLTDGYLVRRIRQLEKHVYEER
jgi:hypothetical protein